MMVTNLCPECERLNAIVLGLRAAYYEETSKQHVGSVADESCYLISQYHLDKALVELRVHMEACHGD